MTSETRLSAAYVASLPQTKQDEIFSSLSNEEADILLGDWSFWARDEQLIPDWRWRIWLILSGRGWGKTRTGAETVLEWIDAGYKYIALVGATAGDIRDTMIEGESGLLTVAPSGMKADYQPSKRRIVFKGGAIAFTRTADKPDGLRGSQADKAWCDELAAWRYAQQSWDMLMFGLRLGDNPQAVVTTTPQPIPLLRQLVSKSELNPECERPTVHVTSGNTYENAANLADSYIEDVIAPYEGTRLGEQEIYGKILGDNPDALWNRGMIEDHRVSSHPTLERIAVAVDPSASNSDTSAETGIIVGGVAMVDGQLHGYILEDLTIKGSPETWATQAVSGYTKYRANFIIGERNNGGDMVKSTLINAADKEQEPIRFEMVWASHGKTRRAEPISRLYEQGRIHHVGFFAELEQQMCEWVESQANKLASPDRMDAMVWLLSKLMLNSNTASVHYQTRYN